MTLKTDYNYNGTAVYDHPLNTPSTTVAWWCVPLSSWENTGYTQLGFAPWNGYTKGSYHNRYDGQYVLQAPKYGVALQRFYAYVENVVCCDGHHWSHGDTHQ